MMAQEPMTKHCESPRAQQGDINGRRRYLEAGGPAYVGPLAEQGVEVAGRERVRCSAQLITDGEVESHER